MLKKIITIVLLGVSVMANAAETPRYWIQYKINNMHCIMRLNGLYLYDTTDRSSVKNITFGHTGGEFLNEGKNELEILAYNLSDFKKLTQEELERGYCEVTITASLPNPETGELESREVTHLRASYNEEKELIFSHSHEYGEKSLSDPYRTEPYEPKVSPDGSISLPRLLGKRTFYVNHPQPFSWVKATPFTDTLENREKLWAVYNELRTAIQRKDMKQLRTLLEPGVTELAIYEGNRPSHHFKVQTELVLANYFDLKREYWLPVKLEDFELQLHAEGKLFQLVEKNTFQASPIQIENRSGVRTFNPVFTYIDGKIVVAFF